MTLIRGNFEKPAFDAALGQPPERLTVDELRAWHDLVAAAGPDAFRKSDRFFIELTAQVLAEVRKAAVPDLDTLRLLREMCAECLVPLDKVYPAA